MDIHSKEGTTLPVEISINFDVNRQEHGNIKYDDVDPANYLGSYLMVPTGKIFSEIILIPVPIVYLPNFSGLLSAAKGIFL